MKRDMELIRKILIYTEKLPAGEISGINSDDHSENEVAEHIALLEEAGLIDAVIRTDEKGCPSDASIRRLTMEGHEFLSNAKNNTVWKKVLKQIKEKGIEAFNKLSKNGTMLFLFMM